jgi:low affinity Fe/Cu permease
MYCMPNKSNPAKKSQGGSFSGRIEEVFRLFAQRMSSVLGSPWTFVIALLIIAVWGLSGPVFRFSDSWQLIINTGTTIITFLMVFLIQNTQNRDAKASHLKLDELIRAVGGARNHLLQLENLSDDELKSVEEQFAALRERASDARE